jgi:hypothetical protein
MCGQCLDPSAEASEDELDMIRWQALHTFLNHMVRELVANTFQHFVSELFGYQNPLIVLPYFQSLKQRQQMGS